MLEIIKGKPREGKSHFAVKYRFLTALKMGRKVYTNIDFGDDEILPDGTLIETSHARLIKELRRRLKKNIPPSSVVVNKDRDFWRKALQIEDLDGKGLGVERGSTIIIDEAQMIWPKGNSRFHSQKFFDFLTYHGHFNINIVFITQAATLMDERISDCCNEFLEIKNMWFLSTAFQNTSKVLFRQSDKRGVEPHKEISFSFDKTIFNLYRSGFELHQRQTRMLPAFMVAPVVGILILGVFMVTKGRKSYIAKGVLGSESNNTAITAPFTPETIPPPQEPVKDSPISKPTATADLLAQLEALKGFTSGSEVTTTPPSEIDSTKFKFHNALTSPKKGYWKKERDGSETWVKY